jgi:hypothetical protein
MKTNVTAKIKDLKFGVKEDQITLTIDGNITDDQVSILRKIKKTGVAFVCFSSSQADFEDIEEEEVQHRGIQYQQHRDGTVVVEGEQLDMDAVDGSSEGDEVEQETKEDEYFEEEELFADPEFLDEDEEQEPEEDELLETVE